MEGKGDLVAPFVVPGQHGSEDDRGEELSEDPACVDVAVYIAVNDANQEFPFVCSPSQRTTQIPEKQAMTSKE